MGLVWILILTPYENFRGDKYDLVILDIKMPGVDGFRMYQKVKRIDSRVKVCFLTATEYFHEEIRKEHGFSEFKQESFLRNRLRLEIWFVK